MSVLDNTISRTSDGAGLVGPLLGAAVRTQLAAQAAHDRLADGLRAKRSQLMAHSHPAIIVVIVVAVSIVAALAIIAAVGIFIYCRSRGYDGVSFYEKTPSGTYYRIGCFYYT